MPTGIVKSYSATKGYGFVEHNGKDVFIMHSELSGLAPKEGTKITFTITQTEKGAQATKIRANIPAAEKQYKGTIKSFNYNKGFGFIESDGFPGQDIFFMKHSLSEQARESVQKGSWCIFKKVDTDKGPQGEEVFLIGAAAKAMKDGHHGGGKGGGQGLQIGNADQAALQQLLGSQGGIAALQQLLGGGIGGGGGGGHGVRQPQFQKKSKGKGKGKGCKWCQMGQCWSH